MVLYLCHIYFPSGYSVEECRENLRKRFDPAFVQLKKQDNRHIAHVRAKRLWHNP